MGFNRRVQYPSFSPFIKGMFHFSINRLFYLYSDAILENTKVYKRVKITFLNDFFLFYSKVKGAICHFWKSTSAIVPIAPAPTTTLIAHKDRKNLKRTTFHCLPLSSKGIKAKIKIFFPLQDLFVKCVYFSYQKLSDKRSNWIYSTFPQKSKVITSVDLKLKNLARACGQKAGPACSENISFSTW